MCLYENSYSFCQGLKIGLRLRLDLGKSKASECLDKPQEYTIPFPNL